MRVEKEGGEEIKPLFNKGSVEKTYSLPKFIYIEKNMYQLQISPLKCLLLLSLPEFSLLITELESVELLFPTFHV